MFGLTIALVAIAFATIQLYVKFLYSYWQRRGIPYLKPTFPFGNFTKTFTRKLTLNEQLTEFYRCTSERFIGIFLLHRPMLLIRDLKLIRSILIADFQYFTDRVFYLNEGDEPLTSQLGALRGQCWRDRRAKLTPAFTPNKLKASSLGLFVCGSQLQQHLSKVIDGNESIEMCEIMACFASNVVASTAFGIDIDCFANPNHPFRNVERKVLDMNLKNVFRFIGWFLLPNLLKWSGLRFVDRDVEEYFMNLVAQTLEMREKNNIVRNDFLQSLIELRNIDDSFTVDENNKSCREPVTRQNSPKSLTAQQVAAQAFNFLLATIKATSLTTSQCLYEIAKDPDIQRQVQAEIGQAMDQHSGQLTYDAINKLKYLDCCIEETFRRNQLLPLTRICVKDYKVPGTNVVIEKGTTIVIPTYTLHHDEKYYPNPGKFDPTRFSIKNKAGNSMIDRPNLSFGDGPRACIGKRMGKMFVKVGICSVLQHYHVELDDRHIGKEMQLSLNLNPIGGIHLKLKVKNNKCN